MRSSSGLNRLDPERAARAIDGHLGRLLAVIDGGLVGTTNHPDVVGTFVRLLHITLDDIGEAIDECPRLPSAELTFLTPARAWPDSRHELARKVRWATQLTRD